MLCLFYSIILVDGYGLQVRAFVQKGRIRISQPTCIHALLTCALDAVIVTRYSDSYNTQNVSNFNYDYPDKL